MQITKVEVNPVELKLQKPVQISGLPAVDRITAIFVRLETRQGQNAWGCTIAQADLTCEKPEDVLRICQSYADIVPSLHPTNIEYSLTELASFTPGCPSGLCAFDLALHDLLGIAADMPLYRLLGGYRNHIQTSVTVPLSTVHESVELAQAYARVGFRMLKVKGGIDPQDDVNRIKSIHRALPHHILRLDADGGYTVPHALEVARALKEDLEMIEQPTPANDLESLTQVTQNSPVPILADQSLSGPASALQLAAKRSVNGFCVKLATCGGFRCARQIDAIARAARIGIMASCVIEPALLIAAGLSFALSSPNVRYADLDGNLGLMGDPTMAGFRLEDGWLTASEVPGLGCTVDL